MNERAHEVLAQGFPGTNSKRYTQYTSAHPRYICRGNKCYVWGEDGQRYVDFVCGLGAVSLGYGHPRVSEAIRDQLQTGIISASMSSPLTIEVGELIREMVPAAESIRFLKTGSEACSAALRIARAASGYRMVTSDGYHGWHDTFTVLTDPAAGVVDDFAIRSAGNVERSIFICEPLKTDPLGDEMALREKVAQKPNVTIFDEVVTGFRVPDYTVSKMWKILPDMIVLGKGIANGMPLAVVAGRRELMGNSDYFVSSTFSDEALSLAACKATLQEMKRLSLKDLCFYGNRLRGELNKLDPEIEFKGYGTRAMFNITHPKAALFAQEMAKNGVLFGKAWFFNFAHMEESVEEYVLNLAYDVMSRIRRGEVKYEGEYPRETFTR